MRKHDYFIFSICLGNIRPLTFPTQARCFLTFLDVYVDITSAE